MESEKDFDQFLIEFSKNYPENGSLESCKKAQESLNAKINQTRSLETLFKLKNWQTASSTIRLMQDKKNFPERHSLELLQSFVTITPKGIIYTLNLLEI